MEKLIAILLIASALTLNAQEENRKNRIKVNISYSSYQSNTSSGTSIDASEIDFDRMGNYQINAIYVFPKSIEFGVYGGYSRNWFNYYNLGISANIQILPFFLPKPTKRLEVYAIWKIGQLFDESYFGDYDGFWEYSGGLGTGIYPFSKKRFGLFAEYTMGKYFFKENDNLKFGISLRII